jgi:hypothetical protein
VRGAYICSGREGTWLNDHVRVVDGTQLVSSGFSRQYPPPIAIWSGIADRLSLPDSRTPKSGPTLMTLFASPTRMMLSSVTTM